MRRQLDAVRCAPPLHRRDVGVERTLPEHRERRGDRTVERVDAHQGAGHVLEQAPVVHRQLVPDAAQVAAGHVHAHRTATTRSTSTGAPNGSSATPMAARACCPTSGPNTSSSRLDAPLTTSGWSPNPGALATYPVSFSTASTSSRSTTDAIAARQFSAHVLVPC